MARDAEPVQQKGIDGVALAKRGLESTTWIELPFNAYRNDTICRVQLLCGNKLFDLFGYIFGEKSVPLYVEAKNYDGSPSALENHYKEFLANAYSATALADRNNAADRAEFMFVTTHPFGLGKWVDNFRPSRIREALNDNANVLDKGHIVDDNILQQTSDLVHLLILNERQTRFMLTSSELNRIEEVLGRKAS